LLFESNSKYLPRSLREWSYGSNRRSLHEGLDGYLIRRAVECATITYDQLKAGLMPIGCARRYPKLYPGFREMARKNSKNRAVQLPAFS
jgi:hypothetical protein